MVEYACKVVLFRFSVLLFYADVHVWDKSTACCDDVWTLTNYSLLIALVCCVWL